MAQAFISHSHPDASPGTAFEEFTDEKTNERLDVERSSKKGSIDRGRRWVGWTGDRAHRIRSMANLLAAAVGPRRCR